MHLVDPSFRLLPEHKLQFQSDGYLKVEGFLTTAALDLLRHRAEKELSASTPAFTEAFSRLKYDFETEKAALYPLIQEKSFSNAICGLTGRDMFFTFEICFELEKSVSRGFPWHVGVQSFGYQNSEDYGCSIWIPLSPIEPTRQGGGLVVVPRSVVSGEFLYEFIEPAIVSTLTRKAAAGCDLTIEDYSQLRTGILNSPAMVEILEQHAQELPFQPGDALLFDKYVIHRSAGLGEGPLSSRIAYVLRFIDLASRYDRTRAENLEYPVREFGTTPLTHSHLAIAEKSGELIAQSAFFDHPELRQLRRHRS